MVFNTEPSRHRRHRWSCPQFWRCVFVPMWTLFLMMSAPLSASAQGILTTTGGSSGVAGTIGDALNNVLNNVKAFEILILGVCCLIGVWLVGAGLLAVASNRGGGDRGKAFQDAGLRIGLGAVVFALPSALGVGLETLWTRSDMDFLRVTAPGIGAPRNCITSNGGLACVANNIAVNIAPMETSAKPA